MTYQQTSVLGLAVDQYTWTDSQGQPRTVSLKREDAANTGHGGYAVQATYNVFENSAWRTVTVNMGSGAGEGGFGYFVGHELYRNFDNGTSGTIAALHIQDDSPLGLGFPVTTTYVAPNAGLAAQSFNFTYPKWGTATPMANPQAANATPVALNAHVRYDVPVSITWTFENGKDYPRIDTRLDISAATAGQLSFDMRGPYGVMEFADSDANATIDNVQWGDSAYLFTSNEATTGFLKQSSTWNWSAALGTTRPFHGLIARHSTTGALYETGLVEIKLGSDTGLVYSGYSSHRGTSGSGFYPAAGIQQYEWPFQSAQYSGMGTAPMTGKKFAWGSSAFYGSTVTPVYLNNTVSRPLAGYPSGGIINYRTCWVLGKSAYSAVGTAGLTQSVAASAAPSCAMSIASTALPPQFLGVVSRKMHGAATFDLPIVP